jgi:Fe-S cluster assembly ATP-binding protein
LIQIGFAIRGSAEMTQPALAVNNLSLIKDKKNILDKINFQIEPGEIFAIIGPNGSGKSSLAYALMGLNSYDLSEGKVYLNGTDITESSIRERAQAGLTLGWQEPARFEGVSVKRFLSLGLESRGEKADEQKISRSLEELGLVAKKYLDRNIDSTLSGGERKRIELSSILLMNPKVVILDEPDSGVDIIAINNISRIIKNFKREGIAVLLITHSDEILKLADKAALLCNGRIIKRGTADVIAEYFRDYCLYCPDEVYTGEVEIDE